MKPLANTQPMKCEGSCEEHRGQIRRVEIKSDKHPNGTWGAFNYCEEAIEEDQRRGFTPIIMSTYILKAKSDTSNQPDVV